MNASTLARGAHPSTPQRAATTPSGLTLVVSTPAALGEPEWIADVQAAVGGEVTPAGRHRGVAAEVLRLAIDWSPQAAVLLLAAKPTLDAVKVALEVVEKLLALIERRRPAPTLQILTPTGPVTLSEATREQVARIVAQEIAAAAAAAPRSAP